MANIIYKTSYLPDWIAVAENMRSKLDWEPVYWLGIEPYRQEVKEVFPDIVYHTSTKASRGIPSTDLDSHQSIPPIDKEVLEKYQEYEPIALKMMGRQDVGNIMGGKFGYDERKRLYRTCVMYWETIINKFDIDAAVFTFAPHMIFDYILYIVCIENNVDTAMFTVTGMPNNYYIRSKIDQTPEELHKIGSDIDLNEDVNRYLENLRADYETGKPSYMMSYDLKEYLSKIPDISSYPSYMTHVINMVVPNSESVKHYKEKDKRIEDSSMNFFQSLIYNIRSERYKSRLSKHYDSITGDINFNSDYVFFTLHYQPERTTCPEGGVFVDQYIAVNLLSNCIPDDWKLYVKEHPHQTSQKYKGELGRKKYMYDDLNELDSVTLVDTDVESFDLIDNAQATATITGTSGWESINRGVPAIVFGSGWYRDCPGCIHVETQEEVKQAIKKVQSGYSVHKTDIRRFMNELEKISQRVYVSSGTKNGSITEEENIKNLSTALSEWWLKKE